MYHKIGIQKLSPAQISRLLNGHAVRVKHGSGHEIHASTEQHKKIHSAHKKGKAHTLTFDPYQIAQHQHLRHGHKKSHGEGEGMHTRHPVHTLPHHPIHTLPHHPPMHHTGGSTYAHRLARRTRNTFKPVSELAGYAIPATLGTLGAMAGSAYGGPVGGIAGRTLGSYAGSKLSHKMGLGEGIKHRGRPRKVHHKKSHGEGEGEGMVHGYGKRVARRRGRGEGEGEGPKRRGRKSKGEALFPAGYGEGEGEGYWM